MPEKLKSAVGRLFGRGGKDGYHESSPTRSAPEIPPELRERAAKDIQAYAEENKPLFNRASRFEEKAERLDEGDGATNESALRRAERASADIREGLSALRERFASSGGDEGKLAFDAELESSYPQFAAPEEG